MWQIWFLEEACSRQRQLRRWRHDHQLYVFQAFHIYLILSSLFLIILRELLKDVQNNETFCVYGWRLQTSLTVGLCVASASHTLSLLSSSFVEEEHQTWYFLTVTMWLVVAMHLMMHQLQRVNQCSSQTSDPLKKPPSSGCVVVTAVVHVHHTDVSLGCCYITDWLSVTQANIFLFFFVFIFVYLFPLNSVNERTNEVYLPMNRVHNDWLPVEAEAHQSWPPKK